MAKVAEAAVRLSLEDKVSTPLKRIKAQFASLSKGMGLDRLAASTKNVAKSLQGLNKGFSQSMGRMGKLTAMLGLGGGGLAASMYGLSKNTAQMAMELGDASKQLGIGVVDLQLWRHAAERSGVGAAKFDSALAQLNKKSSLAAKGNKSVAASFLELGISLKDAGGNLKSADQLMEEVTTSMGKIGDHGVRQRLAAQLFGGDGSEMAAMLGQGMGEIDKLFSEKRSFGDLIGQDVATAGGDLMTNLGSLQGHLNGIKTLLGTHLMPVVNDFIKALRDWIAENKELIQSGITSFCKTLGKMVKDLFDPTSDLRQNIAGLAQGFNSFYAMVSPVVDFLGGPLKVGLIAVAAFIAGPLVAAAYSAASAFISFGIAVMTTPVGWIAAGIAAVIAAGYLLWKNWDKIKAWWNNLWDRMIEAVKNWKIVKWLVEAWDCVSQWWAGVKEWWAEVSLLDEGLKLILSLRDGIFSAFETLKDIGGNIIDWVWEGIKAGWENVKAWFRDAVDALTSWLPDWVREGMGFEVNVQSTAQGLEAVNSTVAHSIEAAQAITNPYDIPELRPKEDPIARALAALEKSKQLEQMQAEQISVQKFEIPEPITVHKPTEIDTSVTIQNLNVQSSGTPEDVRLQIQRAMAGLSAQQSGNVNAALND